MSRLFIEEIDKLKNPEQNFLMRMEENRCGTNSADLNSAMDFSSLHFSVSPITDEELICLSDISR